MRTAQTIACCACLLLACGKAVRAPEPGAPDASPSPNTDGRPGFCQREGSDLVRDVFCQSGAPPRVESLSDLQTLLDLKPALRIVSGLPIGVAGSYASTFRYASVLGHSTALSGRYVSPINPRVISIAIDSFLAFQRGVQQVEIMTRARDNRGFNLYLVRFEQACNAAAEGCKPGDLYTERIESDWTAIEIQDDEQLANTPSDCRQCHRRAREHSIPLMRELETPWTHFFEPETAVGPRGRAPGVRGRDLLLDYLAAKGDEAYGGADTYTLSHSAGVGLEGGAGSDQPLVFDAPAIEEERWPYGPDGYAAEPLGSPTWERAYQAFKRGEQLALPYLEPRATDPDKQARLTEAYQRYRAGELSAEDLPDLADIHPDDARTRARIGLDTEPDATPAEALIQACGSCHNDVLDQALSRARFNIDVSRMSRAELDRAIDRIERDAGAKGVMPPPEARQLHPAARAALLAFLRKPKLEPDVAAQLERAARLGMAGGSKATGTSAAAAAPAP